MSTDSARLRLRGRAGSGYALIINDSDPTLDEPTCGILGWRYVLIYMKQILWIILCFEPL